MNVETHWLAAKSRTEQQQGFRFDAVPSTTPDRARLGTVFSDNMVAMRDGMRLATDVYLPEGEGPFPTVLCRMPYGKTEPYSYMPLIGDHFARKGYAFVVQDVRGKFASEGVFVPNLAANEVEDGFDTVDWIVRQDWADGRVGMWGESYYGYTAYAGAVGGHPGLACIAPGNVSVSRYACTFRNGALQLGTIGLWAIQLTGNNYQDVSRLDFWHLPLADLARSAGLESPYFDQFIENPAPSRFWDERSLLQAFDTVRIPVLHWGGWYDLYSGRVVSDWREFRRRNEGRNHNHLFMGPWDHEESSDNLGRVGRVAVGAGVAAHRWDTVQAFFDRYLRQDSNGFGEGGVVRYYTIGADWWSEAPDWPPPAAMPTKLYLHSAGSANTLAGDGTLSDDTPGDEPADRFTYDPSDPVTDTTDVDCFAIAAQMGDRRRVESRSDVLCYTGGVLDEDLEISGETKAHLYVSTSAPDTDFTVVLVDVFPDGYGNLIQDGILRASFRDPAFAPSNLEPATIYRLEVDLWSTSYLVKKSHRLRVEVSSSSFDRYDRNPNTGEPFGRSTYGRPAFQTIHHATDTPSHIVLSIVGSRDANTSSGSQNK